MNDDELYKHFSEIELNEFQQKSGASKNQIDAVFKKLVYTQMSGNEDDKLCLVCQDDFEIGNELRELSCLHRFHVQCIDEWLGRNAACPVCRKDLKSELKEQRGGAQSNKAFSSQNQKYSSQPQ